MFNSVPYVVGGGKSKTLPADAAMHGDQKAIARLDPITGEALFLFGVKDESQSVGKKNLCKVQGRAPQGCGSRNLQRRLSS